MSRCNPLEPRRTLAFTVFLAMATSAFADEGMWTLDNPPAQLVKQRYSVELTPELLDRLQHAAVNYGASASFVSKNGLILTNHHVALRCIEHLSTRGRDLASTGYTARSVAQELRCPGGMARVLMSTEDVTEVVVKATAEAISDEQRNALRKSAIADLESKCGKTSGLHCEVVSLYSGSLFHLYRFKEWEDVRLVFAPEYQAAFYGGDPDNFVYPRFALDFALFRIYENGKPVQPRQHLKLADKHVAEGDPVFVVGHPGESDRLQTLAQLKAERDTLMPLKLASALSQQALLHAYSARSPEAARQALDNLFGAENWLKAMRGQYAALQNPALMAKKETNEARFRASYTAQGLKGDPWGQVEAATAKHVARAKELWAVAYRSSSLLNHAGKLVELAYERQQPEASRLTIYRDAALPAIERRIKADAPIYKDLEVARLAGTLRESQALLGDQHPYVKAALGGTSPEAAAESLIRNSRLDDVSVRVALLAGGVKAIEASDDPLIKLAREIYPIRRELAQFREEQIDTPILEAGVQLGQARFALYGKALPPDATATLRLSYGKVSGYQANGIATPWKTTFGGLLARADSFDGKTPFDLATQIGKTRSRLDPRVPLNFVTTADIIGGNSGSPVVNSRGEWVGLIFDSNLEALGARFVYTEAQARSLAVDAQAIVYALDHIYGAHAIAQELRGGR